MSKIEFVKKIAACVGVIALVVAIMPSSAQAAQLTARSLTLTSSAPGATGVGYTFAFTAPTATTVLSADVLLCTTASGACTTPSDIVTTGAAVGTVSGLGSGGTWTGTFSTNGRLQIANASNTGSPSTASVQITGITNPSTTNTTIYARITTYATAAWGTPIDTGTVASSTATQINLSAAVDETLTFCTGTSGITSSSCAGATGSSVNLGTLTTTTTGSGTSQIGVTTNAASGYAVSINGATLTSGSNTITALATQTASTQGTSQFGVNLKANTTPVVGSEVAGAGTATATANYGTANSFRFVTGDQIASKNSADAFRLFTVSYIANIAGNTPPGNYTATMTYIATATF